MADATLDMPTLITLTAVVIAAAGENVLDLLTHLKTIVEVVLVTTLEPMTVAIWSGWSASVNSLKEEARLYAVAPTPTIPAIHLTTTAGLPMVEAAARTMLTV